MTPALRRITAAAPLLLLGACMSMPTGPSVMTLPGSQKSFEQFRADDARCRLYAGDAIGGATAANAQTDSAVKSAAVGTAVGAVAGAAIGGHGGAGVGAGTGLLVGALAGSGAANASGYDAQRRYDHAYIQCMYASGHKVPMTAAMRDAMTPRRDAPPPSAAYYPPPPPPGSAPPRPQ